MTPEALQEVVVLLRASHQPVLMFGGRRCAECSRRWPCTTIQAIDALAARAEATADTLDVEAVEGVVRYMRSSTDRPKECICCPGEPSHVFAYYIEVAEGTPHRGRLGSLDKVGWVTDAIRRLPDGAPVRLTIAALAPAQPAPAGGTERCCDNSWDTRYRCVKPKGHPIDGPGLTSHDYRPDPTHRCDACDTGEPVPATPRAGSDVEAG